ncbi:HAD family hydrolase [Nocardia noduli]|uniref:HAD family hydrolase n=1 Tax=Nocardia noduli TaxID=2815722 RepID=UPI001C22F191|nr:HAD-IA family hydrolase [Nocardia noduli]
MPLRAMIFDFDGLILDTETPEFTAWQEVYAAHGATLEQQIWAQVIGTTESSWDPWLHLEGLIGYPVDRETLRAGRQARHHALIAAEVSRPGIESWLDEASDLGLAVGLASSSSREWVTTHLHRLGLLDRFAVIATGDRVRRTKPDPAVYLLALAELGVDAAEAIAVEDSANGIAAAKAAGLVCVAIPNPMTACLDLSRADLVLDSPADMTIREVARRTASGA